MTRSMGRVALLAVRATELALESAGLLGAAELRSGSVGVAYGSGIGSTAALSNFLPLYGEQRLRGISATTYLQLMPHTCAANIALFFWPHRPDYSDQQRLHFGQSGHRFCL